MSSVSPAVRLLKSPSSDSQPRKSDTTVPATVLYVDDEARNLRAFESNFQDRFRILTCSSGTEALKLLSTCAEVRVLVADHRMPGMTGIELLERVREFNPDIQRILMTTDSDTQVAVEAVKRGQATRYFVKPWSKEDVLAALEDGIKINSLQIQLRQVQARLMQSERLASLGQISVGIAHELMNPVSYIHQNVESLRGELAVLSEFVSKHAPDECVQRSLGELPQIISDIETGTRHIRQVASGIRGQARGDEEQKMSDFREVANFAVKLARAEIRDVARLTVEGPSVFVVGGPVQLCQVLVNLVVNAAQAMKGRANTGTGLIQVRWEFSGEQVCVEVQDNGAGIPEELEERIFEPLFTTKPVGEGTGMGLSICRDIVQSVGGDVQINSRVGQGTLVTVWLKKVPLERVPDRH